MRFLKRLFPFAVVVAAALLLLNLPDLVPERYGDLNSFFATERHRQGLIGLTAASVRYGAPDYSGAWGVDARGFPLMPASPMAIGALSRAVTGVLASRAELSGRLDLDKAASAYLPELGGGRLAEVSLRQFLTQSSGLSALDFDDRHGGAKDLSAAVRLLAAALPSADPGSRVYPLETGYEAVGLALERSSKKSFAELAAAQVFGPLAMRQSSAAPDAFLGIPQGATQFFWTALPRPESLAPSRIPAAGIVSSAPDFARLMASLVNPGFGGIDLLGKGHDLRPLDSKSGWSWGWEVVRGSKELELRIESSGLAYSAVAAIWPGRQAGVVILVPSSGLLIGQFVLPSLLQGARSILLADSAEPSFPYGRLAILLGIAAAIHILALSAATGGAMAWAREVKGRAEAKGVEGPLLFARLRCLLGIVLRLAVFAFLPLGLGLLRGARLDWTYLLEWEPGLTAWLSVAMVIGLLRNVARLFWLRGPSSQVKKMRLLLKR